MRTVTIPLIDVIRTMGERHPWTTEITIKPMTTDSFEIARIRFPGKVLGGARDTAMVVPRDTSAPVFSKGVLNIAKHPLTFQVDGPEVVIAALADAIVAALPAPRVTRRKDYHLGVRFRGSVPTIDVHIEDDGPARGTATAEMEMDVVEISEDL